MAALHTSPSFVPTSGLTTSRRGIALRNLGLLVLVNALWALQYPASRVAIAQLPPLTLTVVCLSLACLLVLPVAVRRTRQRQVAQPQTGAFWAAFAAASLLGLIPAVGLLAWGESKVGASRAALIGLSTPVLTGLVAWPLLGERLTLVRLIGLVVSLSGGLWLSLAQPGDGTALSSGEAPTQAALGLALVLGSCLSSAIYNTLAKRVLTVWSGVELIAYSYLVATGAGLIAVAWFEPGALQALRALTLRGWVAMGVLAAFPWALAMLLWFRALTRLDVTVASLSTYLLPAFGVMLSALFLREPLTWAVAPGALLTLAGALLVMRFDAQAAEP